MTEWCTACSFFLALSTFCGAGKMHNLDNMPEGRSERLHASVRVVDRDKGDAALLGEDLGVFKNPLEQEDMGQESKAFTETKRELGALR